MRIALVSNDYFQSFPCIDAGGVEKIVSDLAYEMRGRGMDFFAVTPKRQKPLAVGVEVIETPSEPACLESPTNFKNDVVKILREQEFDIVWSVGPWSSDFSVLDKPQIISIHCGYSEKPDNYLIDNPNIYYRFVSKYQHDVFVRKDWEKEKSFWLYNGISDDEFDFTPREARGDYYLFCASFLYGIEGKGGYILFDLAQRNPTRKFKVYGTTDARTNDFLAQVANKTPNLEWCGKLERGEQHLKAFKEAKAFLQLSILPESAGTTVKEALSKGTPCIGIPSGATKELISNHIGSWNPVDNLENAFYLSYNKEIYQSAYNYSQKFRLLHELNELIKQSESILNNGTISRV